MNLPCSNNLDICKLAAVFNNTSATYKFYWLLAIVESAELGKTTITKQELFARMVTNAWYTVHYFRVSWEAGFDTGYRQADYSVGKPGQGNI